MNKETKVEKTIIIGSGPAGLTAALYTARAMMEPLVLTGEEPGGQLTITTGVENFPGFPDGIQGPDLMMNMRKQAEKFGARVISDSAIEVNVSQRPFTVKTQSGAHLAETIIVATGASAKWLGLPSEEQYRGKGVSSCATCDGFFFKDKIIYTVGGGNVALEDSLFLTKFASEVKMVVRRDQFRGEKILQERVLNNNKISIIWNSEVKEILGDGEKVIGAKIWNNKTNEETEHKADAVFIFIGHKPNTELFKDKLPQDDHGYLKVIDNVKTKIKGIFVAGDVEDYKYRQAITAAGAGCKAALEAERLLESEGKL